MDGRSVDKGFGGVKLWISVVVVDIVDWLVDIIIIDGVGSNSGIAFSIYYESDIISYDSWNYGKLVG